MLLLNGKQIGLGHFPDGTFLIKECVECNEATITWLFEDNSELVALIYLVKHLRSHGVVCVKLDMPYIPNARQDRVKTEVDVFTLKYFAETINWLNFDLVTVLDPHSTVSEALFNNLFVASPANLIGEILGFGCSDLESPFKSLDDVSLFFPDEGSMKRYSDMFSLPYTFGLKRRDWKTGEIKGLDVVGDVDLIKNKKVLIIDDICSRGGTFYHSAKKLREIGAKEVYLWVTHCENTILEGNLLDSGLVDRVFTTNSIFTKEHERISVIKL